MIHLQVQWEVHLVFKLGVCSHSENGDESYSSTWRYSASLPKQLPTEAVAQRRSLKKVFLEILQNSQENTCARVSRFPVNFAKFQRTPFLQSTSSGWSILIMMTSWSFYMNEKLHQDLILDSKFNKNELFHRFYQDSKN